MLQVFVGYDPKQPIAATVLMHSIMRRASKPVSITPLVLSQLPITRRGLTEFTYSRFLCPWLCGFEGQSIFFDADMLMLGDVYELAELARQEQVCVVQNKLKLEWASMIVFENSACKILTPGFVEAPRNALHDFAWASRVGKLPAEWNHCVGYDELCVDAKLVHFTQGIPFHAETSGTEYVAEWRQELEHCVHSVSWQEMMGNSVHAKHVLARKGRAA